MDAKSIAAKKIAEILAELEKATGSVVHHLSLSTIDVTNIDSDGFEHHSQVIIGLRSIGDGWHSKPHWYTGE